jgi:hypothetical protein
MIADLAQWHAFRGSVKKTSNHIVTDEKRILLVKCLQNFMFHVRGRVVPPPPQAN